MPPKQTNTLTSLFSKGVKAATATVATVATVATATVAAPLVDADIVAFYASLTPNERLAHTIATTALGTSYNVRDTHGFRRWCTRKS